MNLTTWLTIELLLMAFFVFGYALYRRKRRGQLKENEPGGRARPAEHKDEQSSDEG